jgi:hypothetical protein
MNLDQEPSDTLGRLSFPENVSQTATTDDYWWLTLQNAGKKFLRCKKKDRIPLNMKIQHDNKQSDQLTSFMSTLGANRKEP